MSGTVGRAKDLTGHRYGMLTVLSFHSQVGNFRKWNCRCDCGKECVKYGHQIRAGTVVSCGCKHRRMARELGLSRVVDLIGKRFGRLVVVARNGNGSSGKVNWLCRCDCGKERVVKSGSLRSGNSESCGCIQKETMHRIRWNYEMTDEERAANRNRDVMAPGVHLWRMQVYRRDGYRCVVCGSNRSGELVAHHKESWGTAKDLRLVVENGDTSCVACHKEFHSRYGWGNNTAAQWNEFVESKQLMRAVS